MEREARERAEADLAVARQTSGQERQVAEEAFNLLKADLEVS